MTLDTLLEALSPRGHRLLGRRLRPYCFAHAAWLTALRSTAVLSPGAETLSDLIIASRICASNSFDQIERRCARGLSLRDRIEVIGCLCFPRRLRALRAAWGSYVRHHRSMPRLWRKPGAGTATAPNELAYVVAMGKAFGQWPGDLWFKPMGEVLHYGAALRDGRDILFWTDKDEEVMAEIEADRARANGGGDDHGPRA